MLVLSCSTKVFKIQVNLAEKIQVKVDANQDKSLADLKILATLMISIVFCSLIIHDFDKNYYIKTNADKILEKIGLGVGIQKTIHLINIATCTYHQTTPDLIYLLNVLFIVYFVPLLIGLFLQIQSTPSNDCPIQQT
jgi:hypothetical protein